jgi:hypothetical protein
VSWINKAKISGTENNPPPNLPLEKRGGAKNPPFEKGG